MRREFPNPVKAQIVMRAMDKDGRLHCEGCGIILGHKKHHIDHTIPDALFADKSRPLTAADGKLLGWDCCHKPKTAVDLGTIAKVKRVSAKHYGFGKKRSTFQCSRDGAWKAKIGGGFVRRDA